MQSGDKLITRGRIKIKYQDDLYTLVDFLNRNLKEKDIIFGLSKEEDRAVITLYDF
jgi:hypothetical protein